jgi:glycosyltransferase involved in cell wall biosynthesis
MVTRMTHVSVVIPLYNKEKYIKRAVNSILTQTHQCFELIVVNDGSTDSSLTKAEGIKDERIRIVDQENLGESAARNRGIEEAKHELIAFLDADDKWEPECLENLVRAAEKYLDAKMIGVAHKIISPEGEMIYPEFKYVPEKEGIIENYFKAALEWHPICASAVVIRKEVFDRLGGFTVEMRYGEDSFMWSKVALNYPVAFIYKYLSVIYRNADNRVSKQYSLINDFPLLKYISSLDKEIEEEYYNHAREYIYAMNLKLAKRCLSIGEIKKAKRFISEARETRLFRGAYIRQKIGLYLSYPVINSLAGIWRNIKKSNIRH